MLNTLDLIDSGPPWYLSVEPKHVNEKDLALAFWDVPVYVDHVEVRANRFDTRIVENIAKSIMLLHVDINCPWLANKVTKSCEKTEKYAPLRLELKRQFARYQVKQVNMLGGITRSWATLFPLRQLLSWFFQCFTMLLTFSL